jgi:hypothetical protein
VVGDRGVALPQRRARGIGDGEIVGGVVIASADPFEGGRRVSILHGQHGRQPPTQGGHIGPPLRTRRAISNPDAHTPRW